MKENQQIFFKNLQKLTENFKHSGIQEVGTIALVYQCAFKIIEQSGQIKPPMLYKYTDLSLNKKIVEKYIDEVNKCSAYLLLAIKESNAFEDLMTDYLEFSNSTNTNLAQYFTPKDISLVTSEIILSQTPIERFNEDTYFKIGDDTGCGAGSLILGLLEKIKNNVKGFEDIHYQSIAVFLNDIDENLSKIAFFQILLSSLLHSKPIGLIAVENKNIITEYKQNKNIGMFIANSHKYDKQ